MKPVVKWMVEAFSCVDIQLVHNDNPCQLNNMHWAGINESYILISWGMCHNNPETDEAL